MEKSAFLDNVHQYIKLLSLYLNKKEASDLKYDEKQLSFFEKLSGRHSLKVIYYVALKETKADVNQDYLNKLEQNYLFNVRKVAFFEKERKDLYQYLNDNKIDFLPLKGLVLANYYPDPYIREFADNDILFLDSKSNMVKAFFSKRGYQVEAYKKSNHDVYLKKPVLNFEMHRALFGESVSDTDFVPYFENYLMTSPIKEGKEHYLKDEDFYIYFTAHTYKHYNHSGCGLRTLVDYYVFLKKHELDFEYINQELNKLDIYKFSNLISKLAEIVFSGKELGPDDLEALYFICLSGTYGTLQNGVNRGVEKKGKFGYFMSRIFPPMSFYKSYYPWAYKTKVLIPIAWIIRFFRILFNNPKKATTELKMIGKSKKQKKKKTKSDTHHK